MARIALEWCRLIENDRLVAHELHERVTLVTLDVRMPPGQRHLRAPVMVKGGGNPTLRIVAGLAWGLSCTVPELPAVRLRVAGLTTR